MKISESQKRALELKTKISQACIECGLNLTVYDGGIGFVDQDAKKIVMLWKPEFTLQEAREGDHGQF